MYEIAKKLLLKNAHTKQLLAMLSSSRMRGLGYYSSGGICITEEEIKDELANRPHVPNKIE